MKLASINRMFVFLCLLLFACQRELHFDQEPEGNSSLTKDANGNCLNPSIGGTFIAGKQLADTNYITIRLDVTTPGVYKINTDTVNGYFFSASGNFTATGTMQVKLQANGTPLTAGTDQFTVQYAGSGCKVLVQVVAVTIPSANASFSFEGAPGVCLNSELHGSYVKDIGLSQENRVNIRVHVSKAGSYSVSTSIINGYRFSGSGNFADTGLQIITLFANGKPLITGQNVFMIAATNTSCTFSVMVGTAETVSNPDHFPLTTHSTWLYDDLFNTGDSIKNWVTDTITHHGNLYKVVVEQPMFGDSTHAHYRKSGINYYKFGRVDYYTKSFSYSPLIYGEVLFLKENLNTGDAWKSDEYSGPMSTGEIIFLQYWFTCVDANATVTIGGRSFTEVYKMRLDPYLRSAFGSYHSTGEVYTYYYAKGIGLIYSKETNTNFLRKEIQIKSWDIK